MKITKTGIDRAIVVLAAAAAPALTLCVDTDAITAAVATDIGAIVAALVAAWHGGSAAQARLGATSLPDDTRPTS